jgi:hypothetical protein
MIAYGNVSYRFCYCCDRELPQMVVCSEGGGLSVGPQVRPEPAVPSAKRDIE